MSKKVLLAIALICMAFGIVIGVLINDIPGVTFNGALGISDILSVVLVAVIGFFFQNSQRSLSETFSSELQQRDVAFSKKQKLMERLHTECFESLEKIKKIIEDNVLSENALGDEKKNQLNRDWRIVSRNTTRIAELSEDKDLIPLGGEVRSVIMADDLSQSNFKYDKNLQKEIDGKVILLRNKLDDIVYVK